MVVRMRMEEVKGEIFLMVKGERKTVIPICGDLVTARRHSSG